VTPTPHDALFKAAFSQPARAAELLRSFLDPALCARIDWTSLVLHNASFVDDKLRAQHADLLFTARAADREIRIYLLLEHKSGPDRWVALWLLRYMVNIWVAHVETHRKARRLPPILPVVIHHGDRGWSVDREFSAIVDIPDGFADHVPQFRFAFEDLATVDADTLRTRGSAATRVALLALKETRAAEDLKHLLLGWISVLHELEREPDGPHALEYIFRYLVAVRDAQEFDIDFRALGLGKASEAIMTRETYLINKGIEQGIEQGIQKGIQKGRQEGQQGLFLRMLRRKFTRIPPAVVAQIESADMTRLELWGDRLLTADTLDEVFADTAA
jgi:predicted transposase/invertase (TIGR01784 family)